MTPAERDAFLREQRTCRVATTGRDGSPHVMPLWYAWDGTHLWLYSITRSQRWTDVLRRPQVAVVVDAGEDYHELRGVELRGTVTPVGEIPRTGEPNDELLEAERIYAERYRPGGEMAHDGRHAWLRLDPDREYSWDFRKLDNP